jgi:transporter family-2 protein
MQLGSPWLAGFVSYAVGTLAMIVVVVVTGNRWFSSEMVARTSWMSWSGGIFGAIFITTAVLAVPRLGAATVLALMVVGQMIGSLLFDHFGLFGLPTHVLTPTRLAGAGLLILGTLLVRL